MPDTGRIPSSVAIRESVAIDRRVARTLKALQKAFISLPFERGYRSISVADIAARADVGRSTFYDHFRSKDEILLKSMEWMLAILADAARPDCSHAPLKGLLSHFWGNRRLARVVLSPPVEPKLRRALVAAVEQQLTATQPDPTARRIAAVRIAAAQLGLLEAWTKGEFSASADQLGEAILVTARR